MKVLQTIAGMSELSGGPSTCTADLMSGLADAASESVELLTVADSNPGGVNLGSDSQWLREVPNDYVTPLYLSRNISRFLKQSNYDIYHTNGLWMWINHATCAQARRQGRPYVITPHGMLYPQALKRSAWKKCFLRKLWFDRDIHGASCLHATCIKEMEHIRDYGYRGPVCVIGNPLRIPEYTAEIFASREKNMARRTTIGFLGRLHPIKRIEAILQGMAIRGKDDVDLQIIGQGDREYEAYLYNLTRQLGLNDRVRFLGFINGYDKYAQLGKLSALFLTSEMENFGMIVPEALAVGTPVFASLGTPWRILNDEKCGWWRDSSAESVAEAIEQIANLDRTELLAMGRRGRVVAMREFEAAAIARKVIGLYRWILGVGPKTDYIYTL